MSISLAPRIIPACSRLSTAGVGNLSGIGAGRFAFGSGASIE